ncbi:MAG: TlpA family protein disulfide reductase [Planctomycetaceae bacterium]|nr:MAG: TlpA family protein disulfide reductase [Planctomycetaceae bacterium]
MMVRSTEFCSPLGRVAIVIMLLSLKAGCNQPQPAEPETAAPAQLSEQRPDVTLQPIDADRYSEVLSRHRGKVVMVDFWALWCPPCVAKFPDVVELHRRFADQGLVVVSISMDEPEDGDAVLEFLANQQATFENYHSLYGVGSAAFEAFDLDAVPHIKLYDRDGEIHTIFSGSSIEPAEMEQVIEALL